MEIVRALPIGATPLKRVADADYGSVEETEAMVTKERSLPKPESRAVIEIRPG